MSKDNPTLAEKLLSKLDAPRINHSTLSEIAREGIQEIRSYANQRVQHTGEAHHILNGFQINEQPTSRHRAQEAEPAHRLVIREQQSIEQLRENTSLQHTFGRSLENNWARQSYAQESRNNFDSYAQGTRLNFRSYANQQQTNEQFERKTPHTNFSSHIRF